MKIFVSWSGSLSHQVALLLKDWLPDVIQSLEPYVSSEDIAKGARWFADVSAQLEMSQFGIICLTAANQSSPWIHFEAGALARVVDKSRVCPLLIDIKASDLAGPLTQFQACSSQREDVFRLLRDINKSHDEKKLPAEKLKKSFDCHWAEFENRLKGTK